MSKLISFQGIYPILATPFSYDESIDLESFDRLIRFMAQIGIEGVTILGVLGESNRLLDREREELIKTAVNAAGDMPVIVGTSHSGTFAALALSQMAEALGADGVMVTPQAEPVPSEDRVFEYYQAIGDGIGIPMVLQDHPASTGVHMSVALISRAVAEIPRVACIKEEATPTPPKIRALQQSMKTRSVPILTGLGALYGEFDLQAGSSGFNTGFAFPEVLQAMVKANSAGDSVRLRELYTRFLPLIVFEQQPGVAVRKEILRMRGLIRSSKVRHPGADLQPTVGEQLRMLLAHVLPDVDIREPLSIPRSHGEEGRECAPGRPRRHAEALRGPS